MLTHTELWQGIDRLASEEGLSVSGLARRAGLDPTAFNPSKRQTRGGRLRWPSTESLAKILGATSRSLGDFVGLLEQSPAQPHRHKLPVLGYAQAGAEGLFDDGGRPAPKKWDEIVFPDFIDPHAYGLEISGESMEPLYRDGDVIIVSPAANIRRGDRVVVRLKDGVLLAKQLARLSANRVELKSLNPTSPDLVLSRSEVSWVARIIWASQ
jgi:phage repressor protein C with HTH and peptisase S24 domain